MGVEFYKVERLLQARIQATLQVRQARLQHQE